MKISLTQNDSMVLEVTFSHTTQVVAVDSSAELAESSNEVDESSPADPGAVEGSASAAEPPTAEDPLRAETCTIRVRKKSASEKVGLDLAMTADGCWVLITKVQVGSLCEPFKLELKPGARLLDIRVNGGELQTVHDTRHAARLIGAVQPDMELELTFMPILDRYGFIISQHEFEKGGVRTAGLVPLPRFRPGCNQGSTESDAQVPRFRRRTSATRGPAPEI